MQYAFLKLVLFNLPFFAYFLHYIYNINEFFTGLFIGLIIFIVPGVAWAFLLQEKIRTRSELLLVTLLFSTVFSLISYLIRLVLGIPPAGVIQALFLFLLTNTGVALQIVSKKEIKRSAIFNRFTVIAVTLFLFLYSLLYLFGTRFVRPLEDNDLELQGTAYGIVKDMEPFLLTDRKTTLYFAHPPLINFYVSDYFLLWGKIEEVKFYYDIAMQGMDLETRELNATSPVELGTGDIYNIEKIEPGKITLSGSLREDVDLDYGRHLPKGEKSFRVSEFKEALLWRLIKKEYSLFNKHPNIAVTRSANIFLSSLIGVLLFYCIYLLSNSFFFSLSAVLLYFSFPSILVLSVAEMYHSISTLALLMMFIGYVNYPREKSKTILFLIGIFSGLSNHKIFILPLAILIRDGYYYLKQKDRSLRGLFRINELVLGFFTGILIFWLYGILINADMFLLDHFKYHIFNRIFHINVPNYSGYLSVVKLWDNFLTKEFLLVSVPVLIFFLKKQYNDNRLTEVLALWFIFGAVSYSVIDWREITHLALIFLPLLISTVLFFSHCGKESKFVFYCFLGFVLVRNIVFLGSVLGNFTLILNKLGWY